MPDVTDIALAREFAASHSEPAFAELVRRHINLVYSVALRYVGNAQDAQDVTQAVFIILAQKAAKLRCYPVLTGWLYETTRFTALRFLRTNTRRQFREQEAYMQSTSDESDTDNVWRQLAPLLEEAMTRLNEKERTLLALRFFENRTGAETAALLGIEEWAGRKRANRALEKLRKFFTKRGVMLSTTAIAGAVSANSVHAAPVGLAKTISAVAIAKGAAAGGSTLALAKGALKIMAWTKAKTVIVIGVSVLLAAGTTTVTIHQINKNNMGSSWPSLNNYKGRAAMLATLNKTPPQVTILPTIFPEYGAKWWPGGRGRSLGMSLSVTDLLMCAYGERDTHMVFSGPTEGGRYDYIANLPQGSEAALRQKIKEQFGVVAQKKVTDTKVWLLEVNDAEKLKAISDAVGRPLSQSGYGEWKMKHEKTSELADVLEGIFLHAPVIDRTGLYGRYDFDLHWNVHDLSTMIPAITDELNQIGLALVPTNMPMEMLVVEKVK